MAKKVKKWKKEKEKDADPRVKPAHPRFKPRVMRGWLCGLISFCRLKISTHPTKNASSTILLSLVFSLSLSLPHFPPLRLSSLSLPTIPVSSLSTTSFFPLPCVFLFSLPRGLFWTLAPLVSILILVFSLYLFWFCLSRIITSLTSLLNCCNYGEALNCS